ncbi:hypothetical protein VTN31DRAFT_6424 [Thermomyces dupontii]|uniref:uncharacterized protein n=1 Tax=Talaromyces thermophilus TaxID=28565 RepID=UPI003742429B
MTDDSSDPIITSYDIYLTDSQQSQIPRYVFQYVDRATNRPYDERHGQKPTAVRVKPKTGLIEVDVPIDTQLNYDVNKGRKFGEALKQSRLARDGTGGAFGMAGGFNPVGQQPGARGAVKAEDVEMASDVKGEGKVDTMLRVQTLGGRVKDAEDGDPLYMLGAFRGKNLYLSPVSAVVQLRPQLHHVDAVEEASRMRAARSKKDVDDEAAPTEARVVDVKVKSAEGGESILGGNLDLLRQMQEERWETYEWVDAETEDAWFAYENYMIHHEPETLPQLETLIDEEEYLDAMSAPRIDPARPEMTGWAMKQNRKKQKEAREVVIE